MRRLQVLWGWCPATFGAAEIQPAHVSEAIQYRTLDRATG
jgi:hypothetical protein